jgi:hypothetical protein
MDSVRIERIPLSRVNELWLRDYISRKYLEQ